MTKTKQQPNFVAIDGVEIEVPAVLPDRTFREAWTLNGDAIEIDWSLARQQFRETASVQRGVFCLALLDAGILSASEAKEAARGGWPATFATFLSGLDPSIADRLEIEWATAKDIRRNHPMIDQLARAHWSDLSEDEAATEADKLFGYKGH